LVRNARLPARDVLVELHQAGLSNQEIGDRYGTTREAVRLALKRAGVQVERVRNDHSRYLPWRLRADHTHDVIARRLRSYSKRAQGAPLSPDDARKLAAWEEFMNGANPYGVKLSVHYDRTDDDGFWLEPARPGDRDYISPPAV
jgi:biotin operon repressor